MNVAATRTPLGRIGLVEEGGVITRLLWNAESTGFRTEVLKEGLRQLEAFFNGELHTFDLPLAPAGTDFQQAVWERLLAIPFGATRTYGDLALSLAAPARPVAAACGANPIPIIIPCHRVVAADGLGGYSGHGGIESKVWLLKHEGAASLLI
jgi:methylated-DNA-[protein]-cysteine S-methyltransferase